MVKKSKAKCITCGDEGAKEFACICCIQRLGKKVRKIPKHFVCGKCMFTNGCPEMKSNQRGMTLEDFYEFGWEGRPKIIIPEGYWIDSWEREDLVVI